jgi:hypothetical protein
VACGHPRIPGGKPICQLRTCTGISITGTGAESWPTNRGEAVGAAVEYRRVTLPLGEPAASGTVNSPWEAALGCKIDVPTLGGPVTLSIPANARNGQQLRLRGRGLPGQPPGDQFAVLRIVNPPADTEAARELFQRMERELPFDPRAHWRQ